MKKHGNMHKRQSREQHHEAKLLVIDAELLMKKNSKLYNIIFFSTVILFAPFFIIQDSFEIETPKIPDWIKNNAGWWAEGSIGDSDFVSGIQFLIKEGILVIPETIQTSSQGSNEIPDWIKNNAGWWAEGSIGDSDFVSGIQYLVEEGIINLPTEGGSTQTEIEKKISTPSGDSELVVILPDTGKMMETARGIVWYSWQLVVADGNFTPVEEGTIVTLDYTYPDDSHITGSFVVVEYGVLIVKAYNDDEYPNIITIISVDGYKYNGNDNLVVK